MQIGSTMKIGPYTLLLQNFDTKQEKNYTAERMIIEVSRNNKPVMMLYPERRIFPATRNPAPWWPSIPRSSRIFT